MQQAINFIKLKSETDQALAAASMSNRGSKGHYEANDLINYNGLKNIGLVLQVHEDTLKVINEQSRTVNVKISDIGKKIVAPRLGAPIQARDSRGNTLAID